LLSGVKKRRVGLLALLLIDRQLALTLKSLGTQHLHSVEIYKTYPNPYSVDDARWHWVRGTWDLPNNSFNSAG